MDQLSDPENAKCSPWNVFGKNHPQTPRLLSRRGPRSPEARLSQHYIGPKMTHWNFSNFCRKKIPGLIKDIFCTYWMKVEVLPHDFCNLWPPKLYKNVQEPFFPSLETFFCWNLKNVRMSIWANVMLRQSRLRASRASPVQKSRSLRVVHSKNFSRATFYVFWVT